MADSRLAFITPFYAVRVHATELTTMILPEEGLYSGQRDISPSQVDVPSSQISKIGFM